MSLQISRTFRVSDGRPGEPFGRGVLLWDRKPLTRMNIEEVNRRALNIGTLAHMILWGKAYRAPDGVLIQAYVTLSPYLLKLTSNRWELWTIEAQSSSGSLRRLTVDLPSVHFAFRPVLLDEAAVARYESIPALAIYADRTYRNKIGQVGEQFRALTYTRDAVRLMSNGVVGWVPLPFLADRETEIEQFTGGMMMLLRGDFGGARLAFDKVLERENLGSALRTDVLLLRGLVEEKLGRSGLAYFRIAYQGNPARSAACQYLIAGLISETLRKRYSVAKSEIPGTLDACAAVIGPDEEWFGEAKDVFSGL
jgi:hypothetical protein